MPISIDGDEYYTIEEARQYLGGISRETLRKKAQKNGIKRYAKGISRTIYYRKSDLDQLNELRPLDEDK
ncbi:DNA-binding protein [Ktedonosporobacter rubrisoli]|uniref:DNA-binding protein n=1 Tax=Ktedonosporobacter rubrisoli TaxID=2509675 RepID=A0A4P6K1Z7_KTERU|nr:helix-turn-helix domain-containing protein [Ktedonosporobacter rubrisoli]QBD82208.1 DNA-binding protein [Ktedonosporobacter rubrisoli]